MRKKIVYMMIAGLGLSTLSACNDWLDVSPREEVKVEENFTAESGFKEALTGVYLLMKSNSLYGRELTYGMTDVLAQQWGNLPSTDKHYQLLSYDYEAANSEEIIADVWSEAYNAIANANVLINHIDEAPEVLFTANNRAVIRGEAYALRAMLHFDMLRLFAPSPAQGIDRRGIPYVTRYGKDTTAFSTVGDCLERILSDLAVAADELKADPVYEQRGDMADDESYLQNRGYKLNYYAVRLLQARVNLYKGDFTEALAAAKEVIGQSYFTWTPSYEITTTDENARNRMFTQELLFGVYATDLADRYDDDFTRIFVKSDYYWGQLFETSKPGYSGDYRYAYLTSVSADGYSRYSSKWRQPAGNSLSLSVANTIPLLRLSEAYYVAAEAALELSGNVADGVGYLNTVRTKRNIMEELPATLTPDEFREEIYKEYAKEFIAEGQLFFYFKRTDRASIPNYYGTFTPDTYIVPIPSEEISNR
ncbi:MAG: RagB/SusD family nutrient uptake outer membrane protein [Odoribacter sp.]|nr:RagB/SusD family nutrient uptake outer membrane protein [Odoribacter sp.]